MKLAFISDIHGNAVALEAVLQDLQKRKVDKVFVLGDICFRGPKPKRALEMVRTLDCEVIKGNADEWVVRGVKDGEVPEQALNMMNKERDWTVSLLSEDDLDYLSNLPTELFFEKDDIKIHAFHATPDSLFEIVQPSETDEVLFEKLMMNEANVYLYAHIHKPYIRYIRGKCLMNLGSVGLPFDGLNKASYGLVEINDDGFQTSITRVGYDVQRVIEQFAKYDYPNSEQMINILKNAGI